MKPQTYRNTPRAVAVFRLPLTSLTVPRPPRAPRKGAAQQSGSLLAQTAVVLFLLGIGKVFAQQTPAGEPGWAQNDQYNTEAQRPYPDSDQPYPPQGYGQTPASAQPLNAEQLEQLVAPIALYPDALVAQVLAASTYSDQIAEADHWRQMQGYASPDQVAAGADAQNWDPSVKGLTAFPQVLAQMDRNLQWTTDLGNAYYNQPQDVLEAVQVMRARAQTAGTLQSSPQQAVNYGQRYIQVMPVNPQVVYVPTYNPWTVYGEQVSPYPGFSLLGGVESFLGSSPIEYGLGIAMNAFSHMPWGWLAWGLNWLAQSVLFQQSDYYSHSTTVADWGFRHDGLHAYAGRGGFARHRYGSTSDGFLQFGGRYNGNRGQGFGRSSNKFTENWRGNFDRGFHAFGSGYDRTPHPAQSYRQAPDNRRQFDRRAYGSSLNRSTGEGYRGGAGRFSDTFDAGYRAPISSFQRGEFAGRSSLGFARRDFARSTGKPSGSGAFHLFGAGRARRIVSSRDSAGFSLGGGRHAPKGFHGRGKNFGGGHWHGGGGHSGGHGGGNHHR